MRAIGTALGEEKRGRAAEWKAAVDASLDLPDPTDLDAMLPEITGEDIYRSEYRLVHLVGDLVGYLVGDHILLIWNEAWGGNLFRRFCKMFLRGPQAVGPYCSCHAAQASRGNFKKTYYNNFGTSCRPRL